MAIKKAKKTIKKVASKFSIRFCRRTYPETCILIVLIFTLDKSNKYIYLYKNNNNMNLYIPHIQYLYSSSINI